MKSIYRKYMKYILYYILYYNLFFPPPYPPSCVRERSIPLFLVLWYMLCYGEKSTSTFPNLVREAVLSEFGTLGVEIMRKSDFL